MNRKVLTERLQALGAHRDAVQSLLDQATADLARAELAVNTHGKTLGVLQEAIEAHRAEIRRLADEEAKA